ncbi:MAG TPA: UDP-3-O-(3-hydroxymyristoyl)glucosamine N-acyltransferase [Syntrophorhabdaceae bacterium]|nr:UDP-3-O-(3-hydroxymyristoyl)glucosamine N-acyltransferase [Syntrophorhabdaceae bacterium]
MKDIATAVQGILIGDGEVPIAGVSSIKDAKAGDITFLTHRSYKKYLPSCRATAVMLGKDIETDALRHMNIIVVDNPGLAYIKIAELFLGPAKNASGISPLAFVSTGAHVDKDASIAPYVYIGEGAVVKKGATLFPFVYIGDGSVVGEDTTIYPHVTIYKNTSIGRRVAIHGGTVIGSDGFGYIWDGKQHAKIPQLGSVEIEDDVEIGANVAIDRASLGKTIIKKGTKIDNLVQVAHNVSIGENSIIVAHVGIAGSATIGSNVVLAGQVGVKDHINVGSNVMAGGQTGITKDVPDNMLIMGTPHMPHREWMKLQNYLKKLPALFERIKKVERKLNLEENDD